MTHVEIYLNSWESYDLNHSTFFLFFYLWRWTGKFTTNYDSHNIPMRQSKNFCLPSAYRVVVTQV